MKKMELYRFRFHGDSECVADKGCRLPFQIWALSAGRPEAGYLCVKAKVWCSCVRLLLIQQVRVSTFNLSPKQKHFYSLDSSLFVIIPGTGCNVAISVPRWRMIPRICLFPCILVALLISSILHVMNEVLLTAEQQRGPSELRFSGSLQLKMNVAQIIISRRHRHLSNLLPLQLSPNVSCYASRESSGPFSVAPPRCTHGRVCQVSPVSGLQPESQYQ